MPIINRNPILGQYIRSERLNRKIGLRDFAQLCNIDLPRWSRTEGGIEPPTDRELKKVADYLNLPLEILIEKNNQTKYIPFEYEIEFRQLLVERK
jgi:transcriptional regulator with XRE-family HTH domain